MKLWSPLEFFHKIMSHEQLPFMWSTLRDCSMGAKLKYFLKNSWKFVIRLNFFTKSCLTNNYFSRDPHFVILAWIQSWNIFEKLMKLWIPSDFIHKNMSHEQLPFTWSTLRASSIRYKVEIFLKNSWNCEGRQNLFTKTCLTNNYLSRDPHCVILKWVQGWNIFEKLMKLWNPPESFHKKCLTNNYFFWVFEFSFHEFFENTSTLYPCCNHEMWITWKVTVRETCFCKKIQVDFTVSWVFRKYFNFVLVLESRNMHHVKSNCSWDMFLWKNSGGLHIFMSSSEIFQFCTYARITKCGSHEKSLFGHHSFISFSFS